MQHIAQFSLRVSKRNWQNFEMRMLDPQHYFGAVHDDINIFLRF